ncbi:MAG: DUF4468 domain-containing protein [Flavobacteriales bacterium]|nr:DUF4468 domain-containing protein [Flavobacteriales bacterium]MCB9168148.1 DUF4468 domain-containing protein [Flavobacteriales bacterium]MCB9194287.1 DUF4468 domain-containing protein [Flavobacteriales bacterium]
MTFVILLLHQAQAQGKRHIIPRDSITDKYTYQGVSDTISADKEQLRGRLEKWIKQNYNPEERQYASSKQDGDSYTMHDREALPGKARKYVEYDLTVDIKDKRYRYKLTHLEYIAVGKYPLEDKMATDKRSDLEEIHTICSRIVESLDAAMKKGDDW